MIQVRVATAADVPAVDGLLQRVYPKLLKDDYAPSVRVLVLPRIARAQRALVTCGSYFVAVDPDHQIVGAGGVTLDRRDASVGHIRHVVSDDRKLRQGIGKAILQACFDQARSARAARLVCWSTFTAEPFYASVGFQRQRVIDVPLDSGITFPAVEMTRTL